MTNGFRCACLGALLFFASVAFGADRVLHRGSAAEPPTLDPTLGAGTLASPIIGDMFVGLLAKGPDSQPTPACAESWTVSEDGLTYTFKLRDGLRWSDGTELTAGDFVYSYQRLMDPKTASRVVGVFFPVKNAREVFFRKLQPEDMGVSAPDPRTVVFELEERTPYFLELLGNVAVAPVPRHVIEAEGRGWSKAGTMVSNGPFVLAERVPQSFIRLVKNPYFYAADEVGLDEVMWYPTQNLATAFTRFRAGELDIALNFPPGEIDWIKENIPDSLRVTPNLGIYFLVVNMREPPYDDLRVRKALSLAIDREAITDRLLRTGVTPAYTFATPYFSGYPGIRMPEQSLAFAERQAQARALLKEAGFPPGKLVIQLNYDTQEENRKIMVAIAAMWQAVGVRTEMTDVEFPMLNRLVRTSKYEVARWFYIAPYDDPYAFLQLFSSRNPNNWPGFKSERYDELLQKSNGMTDPQARMQVLAEAEAELMANYPVLPISYYVGRRLVSPRVKGWYDSANGPTPSRYLTVER